MPKLLITNFKNSPQELHIEETVVRLGRSAPAELIVPHPSVSEMHCELNSEPHGCVHVKDLNSRQGIWIHGVRVAEGLLQPGQKMKAGEVEFLLLVELPQYSTEPAPGPQHHTDRFETNLPPRFRASTVVWKRSLFWILAGLFLLLAILFLTHRRFGWLSF